MDMDRFRIRVGVFRVVFHLNADKKAVTIEFVRHRKNIYKHI